MNTITYYLTLKQSFSNSNSELNVTEEKREIAIQNKATNLETPNKLIHYYLAMHGHSEETTTEEPPTRISNDNIVEINKKVNEKQKKVNNNRDNNNKSKHTDNNNNNNKSDAKVVSYYLTVRKPTQNESKILSVINDLENANKKLGITEEEKQFGKLLVELSNKFENNLDWSNLHYPSLSAKLQLILSPLKSKCNTGELPDWALNINTFENERYSIWKNRYDLEIDREIKETNRVNSQEREKNKNYQFIDNPYLQFFQNIIQLMGEKINTDLVLIIRQIAMREYSYSIPTTQTILQIKSVIQKFNKNTKILEIGAGSGYWANLLTQIGCDVIACDDFSDQLAQYYFPVINTPADDLMKQSNHSFDDYALLYCWPRNYPGYLNWNGKLVIVICEENGRPDFLGPESKHQIPDQHKWRLEATYPMIHWPHVPEVVYVYRKIDDADDVFEKNGDVIEDLPYNTAVNEKNGEVIEKIVDCRSIDTDTVPQLNNIDDHNEMIEKRIERKSNFLQSNWIKITIGIALIGGAFYYLKSNKKN